ncbi:ShlB/FhaC/HecB family hemolysin secretion/activation protein [Sphingomonas sp. Y38-1Y]|uniref:ShlB/FhaC/HecB family hemolysin secretion/activation protein n=1 Tax=Sphingomonas sp. Y38-1Y TaxID=3078265 RepID=UPI0028E38781|nr:ShlB/FhaC/HecB family hemolysin secretion/activation protein [Sphingomonas sp. Y38-1Y]
MSMSAALLVGAALLPLGAAAAQQTVPPPALPSTPEITPPAPEPRATPRVDVDTRGAVEQAPCPFADSALTVDLTRVAFTRPDGSAPAPAIAAALSGITVPTGTQPIRVICDIRDAANAALRRRGWVASIQVPPQQIAGGELKLNVVTARIVQTRVRGDAGPYEALLRARVAQLEALDPLNEIEAARILLLADDVPGLNVRLALRPAGTAPGEVIGELAIDYRRFAVVANVQNYNSRLLGREVGYVRGEFYGLTGMGDITYLGASSTADFDEQVIVQGGHIMTLGTAGTTFGVRATHAWSRPDLDQLDYRTKTLVAGFDVTQPLVRSVRENVTAGLGFDYIDQTTDLVSGDQRLPLSKDKLRVGFVSIDGNVRGLRGDGGTAWSLAADVELRKGLDIFDPSEAGFAQGGALQSRLDGRATAFVVRASVRASAAIGSIFSVAGESLVQWTNDPLLNYEEFSLGNLTIGRGYDPGANSGDRAAAFRGELRADVPVDPKVAPQVFGFYDYVHLDNLDENASERNRTLRSYGGGLHLRLFETALLELTYAHPIDRALLIDRRRPPDRLLASLTWRFQDRAR